MQRDRKETPLSGQELKRLQNMILEMMLEVDRICKKHNIRYFLGGGTLLGAVRHKGFIPWDDDADLMMLREDFERFDAVVREELSDEYVYQYRGKKDRAHYPNPKIRKRGTTYATPFALTQKGMHKGVTLDIFVHDKTADSKWGQKLHLLETKFYRGMTAKSWAGLKSEKRNGVFNFFVNFLLKHSRVQTWEKRMDRAFRRFYGKPKKYLYDGMGEHYDNGVFPVCWLKKSVLLPFEGYRFPAPKEYDRYLKYSYGDYMTLPPEEKRVSNHDIALMSLDREISTGGL